ncbi:MAG TPA: glycosyltransferase family 2 protein, partial [Actinobacteria bacterium]|nr:glycosyltransferase family 2 protein [Actinomycetota bacterium]
ANNQAIKVASGGYVLLLNSDTVVLDDALNKMVKFMDDHPEAGALGPKILNPDGSLQRSAWNYFPSPLAAFIERFYLYKLLPKSKLVKNFEVTLKEHKSPQQVAHLLGACLLIRHETLQKVGFLDEKRFDLFLEETDLCLRIKKFGQKIYYFPDAEVVHCGQKSVNQDRKSSEVKYFLSYCRFFKKHNDSKINLFALKFILLTGLLVRTINYRFIKNKKRNADELMKAFKAILKNINTV